MWCGINTSMEVVTSYLVDGKSSATFMTMPGSGRSIDDSTTLTISATCMRDTIVPSSEPANRMSPLCLGRSKQNICKVNSNSVRANTHIYTHKNAPRIRGEPWRVDCTTCKDKSIRGSLTWYPHKLDQRASALLTRQKNATGCTDCFRKKSSTKSSIWSQGLHKIICKVY